MSELSHSVHWISVACVQTSDSGLASYVAGQIDRSLSWKVHTPMDFYTLDSSSYNIVALLQSNDRPNTFSGTSDDMVS
jgi:hypothetical protein